VVVIDFDVIVAARKNSNGAGIRIVRAASGWLADLAGPRVRPEKASARVYSKSQNKRLMNASMYLPTREIVARINVDAPRGVRRKPLVFQIAYDNGLAPARTEVLRRHGYEVVSVIGNEAAKLILSLRQRCDVFIVGHAAPEEERKEIVAWLKTQYPEVRILALNSPTIRELVGADYNVKPNGS
jgi:hypothetical protein